MHLQALLSYALAGLALLSSSHVIANPVLGGYNADPNIKIFGKTYYIYPTEDGAAYKNYYVWKSTNLVDWTRSANPILTLNGQSGPGNVPWATGEAWAPTIAERGGRYYFYHSGTNPNAPPEANQNKTIGVAVASSPEGPFTAQPQPIIYNNEALRTNVAIDPQVYRDPVSGNYYLYWGNGLCLWARLRDDMLSIDQSTLGSFPGLQGYMEAPFVFYRAPYYYMTYSVNVTMREDYRVAYATSASPTGPWTSRGVILQKRPQNGILSTGHQSVVHVPGTTNWYMAYHRWAIPDGGGDPLIREVCIDRMEFDPETNLIREVVPTLEGVGELVIP